MKQLSILSLIVLITGISCNTSSNQRDNTKLSQTEIIEAKQLLAEKAKRDSIIHADQYKAIGNVNFNMHEVDVQKAIEQFKKDSRRPKKIMDQTFYDYYIGEYQYFQILDFYDENRLYKILINGNPISWENYDIQVAQQIKYITDVLVAKYGEPDVKFPFPPRYEIENGYTYLQNSWSIGEKKIEVRLSGDDFYNVDVIVYLSAVADKINNLLENEIKESTENAKDVF